jgi:hypothetical protein
VVNTKNRFMANAKTAHDLERFLVKTDIFVSVTYNEVLNAVIIYIEESKDVFKFISMVYFSGKLSRLDYY